LFNDTSTTQIYPLSLHDALPISHLAREVQVLPGVDEPEVARPPEGSVRGLAVRGLRAKMLDIPEADVPHQGFAERTLAVLSGQKDRKSTRLNSSHSQISYAVFCL